MAFKKGMSGNPKGRPAGAKDKKSEKLREWLTEILKKHRGTLAEDLAAVDPATRWNIIAKILPYILPRLNAVEIEGATDDGNKEPLFIVMRSSGINPASSEEEVKMREQEKLEQMALAEGRPVIRCADELEVEATKAIIAQNNARHVQQQRRSGIIRQY